MSANKLPPHATGGGAEADAQRVTIANDSTGVVSVDDNGANLSVDWAGTPPPIGAGTEAAALRVTVANDSTGLVSVDDNGASLSVDDGGTALEVSGDGAHDAAVAGNPVLLGAVTEDAADAAPGNRVATEGNMGRLAQNGDGALYVITSGPQQWSYHEDSSTALTDAVVHAAPGAGLSLYVTDVVYSTGAATADNIFFEEGATKVLGPWYLEAIAGRGLAVHFATPKKITANTALTVTTGQAIAHSIDVTGFIAPG